MRLRPVMVLVCLLVLVAAGCGDDASVASSPAESTTTLTGSDTTPGADGFTQVEGVLTVGSDIPYPPFEDFDGSGNVVGFDADVINEIATRLGLTVVWVDTDFDTIFTQLATGRFDVVISAVTITPERARQVSFSESYYDSRQALTVNTELTPDIRSFDALEAGDVVAVQTGTTGSDWATANLAPRGIEVREFPAVGDAYNAAEAGQVTGVVSDEPSAVVEVGNRAGLEIVQVIDTDEHYGIAVDPNRGELLTAINAELAAMRADGTYDAIYDEWFASAFLATRLEITIELQECTVDGSTDQVCDPATEITVELNDLSSAVDVRFTTGAFCSPISVAVAIDGGTPQTTGFLGGDGTPAESSTLTLPGPFEAGTHLMTLQATGQQQGCNTGFLNSWFGTLQVTAVP